LLSREIPSKSYFGRVGALKLGERCLAI
jgi:hypothetical protein